jgi:hypothetical protein
MPCEIDLERMQVGLESIVNGFDSIELVWPSLSFQSRLLPHWLQSWYDYSQVCLRIRPSATNGVPKWAEENCIHATSMTSIVIAAPQSSQL